MNAPNQNAWRYNAFISYSHAADGRLAPALQNGLELFAKPWNRLRAVRIFRDDASLSANPGLWPSIQQALEQSEYFLLLASPEAAASTWVTREIDCWCRLKQSNRLLIVLTEGDIVWNSADNDFDWPRTTALPRRLQGVFADEPRFVDLRWARTVDHVSMSDPRFREVVADLAAPLHGREKDELIGEDVRQHRRFVRYRNIAVAALGVLAIGLGIAAITAYLNGQEAIRERNAAEARLLISQSLQAREKNYDAALLMNVEAYSLDPSLVTRTALLQTIESRREVLGMLHGHHAKLVGLAAGSSGAGRLVSVDADGLVIVYDLAARSAVQSFGVDAKIDAMALHPGGNMIALATGGKIRFWDLTTRAPVGDPIAGHDMTITSLAFAPNGNMLASTSWDNTAVLWDVPSRQMLHAPLAGHKASADPLSMTKGVLAGAFSPDGRLLATAGADNKVVIWDTGAGTQSGQALIGHSMRAGQLFPGVTAVAFSPDNQILASGGRDHEIRLWSATTHEQLGEPLRGHEGGVTSLAFDPTGQVLFSADEFGSIRRWDLRSRTPTGDPRRGHDGAVTALVMTSNPAQLVSAGADAKIVIWDPSANPLALLSRLAQHLPHTAPGARPVASRGRRLFPDILRKVVFSMSGKMIASLGDDGTVVAWDSGTRKEVDRFSAFVGPGYAAAFDPADHELAVGGLNDAVIVHRIGDAGNTELNGHGTAVGALAFSADGKLLAAGTASGSIVLWRRDPWTRIGEFHEHEAPVSLVTFGRNGREIVSVDKGGTAKIWQWSGSNAAITIAKDSTEDPQSIDATDEVLAIQYKSKVTLSNIRRRTPFGAGTIPLSPSDAYGSGVALSADGAKLAVAQGTQVSTYDTANGAQQSPWLKIRSSIGDIALSPDGKSLAAVGQYEVSLWNLDPASWVSRACEIAGRGLTEQEWQQFLPAHQYRPVCTRNLTPP